jgi:hypothetical protein
MTAADRAWLERLFSEQRRRHARTLDAIHQATLRKQQPEPAEEEHDSLSERTESNG